MKLLIRFQLILVSVLLLVTFALLMIMTSQNNYRWDFTKEKIYSLSPSTLKLLEKMQAEPIDVLAFFPHEDSARGSFEVFLKEFKMHHPHFTYHFYDPDRVPKLAKEYEVKDFYTVVIRFAGRTEKVVGPSEENFANALLKLLNPKQFGVCFVTGHGEAALHSKDRNGLKILRQILEDNHYRIEEIILNRDHIPPFCQVVVVPGPHRDLDFDELDDLKKGFSEGRGIFFMIYPMDPGTGASFRNFMKEFGVVLGEDVLVDKMSRVEGGDFLVPLVKQYFPKHPITEHFDKPTFFPVARSVQPSIDGPKDVDVFPLAMTSQESWAERDLKTLEKGEATFESKTDLIGPIPMTVAVEKTASVKTAISGRMVVVGDSDFLANAYIGLSGNMDFALNIVQWLARDDRFIEVRPRQVAFDPLFLEQHQKLMMLLIAIVGLPLFPLLAGSLFLMMRRK